MTSWYLVYANGNPVARTNDHNNAVLRFARQCIIQSRIGGAATLYRERRGKLEEILTFDASAGK